jgi:hypothetical protein
VIVTSHPRSVSWAQGVRHGCNCVRALDGGYRGSCCSRGCHGGGGGGFWASTKGRVRAVDAVFLVIITLPHYTSLLVIRV